MRRADRLFQIILYMRGGRLVTAQRLAERFEVSERTIYRDIADLQASGVPIDGEAGLGYILRSGFELPPLMFTKAEIVSLVIGARIVRAWGGAKMALAAQEALMKIETVLPDDLKEQTDVQHLNAFQFEMEERDRHRLDAINQAIEARHVLTLHYEDQIGEQSQRDVEPLGLFYWGKVWTMLAWCRLRVDFRTFRIDRIADMTETGDTFPIIPGQGLEDYLANVAEREGHNFDFGQPG